MIFFFFEKRKFIDSEKHDIIFKSKNQSSKNIKGRHNVQVNNKNKRLKAYTISNLKIFRIPKILNLIKHIDE